MRLRAAFASMAIVAFASSARADDVQRARTLIEEGQALLAKNDVATACERFRQSNEVYPSGAAIMNLADCYERNGQYASAHARFLEAADRALGAGISDIEAVARKRARDLEPRVSTLRIRFVAEPPTGAVVKRDGITLPQSSWTVPAPLDPGTHRISVSAPGYDEIAINVEIARERSAPEVLVPALVRPIVPVVHTSSNAQRTVGWTVGGMGAVGIAMGAVFGIITIADHGTVASLCPNNVCSSTDAMTRAAGPNADSQTFGLASTIAFIAGATLAVVGLTVVFTSPKRGTVNVGLGGVFGTF